MPKDFTNRTYTQAERLAWLAIMSGNKNRAAELLKESDLFVADIENEIIPIKQADILFGFRNADTGLLFPKTYVFWGNISLISKALSASGEPLTLHFLETRVSNQDSLLNLAESYADPHGPFLSDPECWENNEKELIAVHNAINRGFSLQSDLFSVVRKIFTLRGEPFRPDLVKAILKREDRTIDKIVENCEVELYEEMLLDCGLEPHPDDILIPYNLQRTLSFNSEESLKAFPKWVALFKKYGHEINPKDLLRKYGSAGSIISKADIETIGFIFDYQNWMGRSDALYYIREHMDPIYPVADSEAIFWKNYNQLEIKELKLPFPLDENLTREMLLTPLLDSNGEPSENLPLGCIEIWDNFDKVQNILAKKGEAIYLADLYLTVSRSGETAFMRAAKWGYLYLALGLVDTDLGMYIDPEECLQECKSRNTLFTYLEESGQLNELIDENLWVGNPKGMKEMWDTIPEGDEKAIIKDFGMRMARLNRISLMKEKRKQLANRKASPKP